MEKLRNDIEKLWSPDISEDLLNLVNNPESFEEREPEGILPTSTTLNETKFILELIEKLQGKHQVRKVTYTIPSQIFSEFEITLEDIKVDSRNQPDDKVYSTYRELRQHIPRGMSILKLKDVSDEFADVVVYANKKFTGSPIDEDNDEIIEQNYKDFFIQSYETTENVLCMEKVNGEAAHVSGRYIGDQFFFIAGSKNVHMLFNEREHIDLYGEQRFAVAKDIAYQVFDLYSSLSQAQKHALRQFLHKSRGTIACEVLRKLNQHIVPIEKDELKAFCITPPPVGNNVEDLNSLTLVSPLHSLQLLDLFGFNTPAYEVISLDDINVRSNDVRNRVLTEGEVHYYLDKDENTIGLFKIKSIWYIMIRAIRQKTFSSFYFRNKETSLQEAKARLRKRMKEFLRWLQITEDDLERWANIGVDWLDWFHPRVSHYTKDSLMDQFPVTWKMFMDEREIQAS